MQELDKALKRLYFSIWSTAKANLRSKKMLSPFVEEFKAVNEASLKLGLTPEAVEKYWEANKERLVGA